MANYKKIAMGVVAVVMASSMALSLAACDKDEKPQDETISAEQYEANSAAIYDYVLGDFEKYYTEAKETENLAKRFALMAQAEAKLYASGVLLPTQANGGNYAVSKVANNTVNSTLWGNDSYRLHNAVVTTKPVTKADRTAMKTYWNDSDNATQSGVDYIAWVKNYLTEHGYTIKNEYNRAYTGDPATWDVLATSQQSDSEPIVQTYDGLIEYDVKNHMQPAMATAIPEAVAAEKDGEEDTVTYTFNIRTGQKWVTSQGQDAADFKASDFATGFQHMMDAKGGLEYLVDGVVVGAHEYMEGTAKDFSKVGVTADDSAMTVTYRVYKSTASYFLTMLGYSAFAPMSKSYYESKGGKFGTEYDAAAESYLYGKDKDSIAYCGPYLISEHTKENKITFTKNDKWWNSATPNARNVDTINWLYNNNKDITKAYTDFKAGTIDGCGLTGPNVESAKSDKWSGDSANIFDTYAYTSAMDATAFCGFLNVNRVIYHNNNDANAVVSNKTDAQKEVAVKALKNVHLRRAIVTSVDRITYMTHMVGEDLAETAISNMYTPGTFVSLPEEVTIKVGMEMKTYPAGTQYGQIVQDQLDADGIKITVWKEVDGAKSYTGFDGWYNEEYAKAELKKAQSELLALYGVTVDTDNPVVIDYPYLSSNTSYSARANALKQNIEEVLGGVVKINLIACNDGKEWQYAGYNTASGMESNYDLYDLSGWGPDYGDPATYLDTMLSGGAGYMTKCLGMF